MRRSILILAVFVLSAAVTPVPAEAFFWKWLDDLSGPQFAGVSLDVRIWCGSQGSSERRAMLTTLEQRLTAAHVLYGRAERLASPPERPYYAHATRAANEAAGLARTALEPQNSLATIDDLVFTALAWRAVAIENARWAEHVARTGDDDATKRPATSPTQGVAAMERVSHLSVLGGAASVCGFHPLDINRTFLSVNVGYAWDTKDDTRDARNRMLTVGGSVHWVPAPALALGVGAGRARFWSRPERSFQKWYVQPLILDVRPLSIGHDPRFRSLWWHTFYVRYSVITFPGGFEAGRFGGNSPKFPTEFVQSVGLHFDAEPLFRHWRKKGW